ncbi:hypothetical protein A33M_1047 [Rhodovulum sp. PH10]|uniref:methyltransferase family protein n=1 Tax=Rhodovulum sp. PH10 TaxID=1187851 RepID=UPI00027C20AA|nr:isoprenylcysteine carboxylmethyltransferase family protein [Rhodovulum sp. PH10]EJW09674.1 hypothetical protein A33M_1047 [Rhodovulum sp. PH10]
MAGSETDRPGVIAPPPVIAVVTLAVAALHEWLWPSSALASMGLVFRLVVAALLIGGGGALAVIGERRFKAAGTEALPWRAATALVTDGLYARMRNPMYVGLGLAMLGIAFAFGSDWLLLLLIPAALVLHYGVVLREERYLERKFGDAYRVYKTRVARYGWPPPL